MSLVSLFGFLFPPFFVRGGGWCSASPTHLFTMWILCALLSIVLGTSQPRICSASGFLLRSGPDLNSFLGASSSSTPILDLEFGFNNGLHGLQYPHSMERVVSHTGNSGDWYSNLEKFNTCHSSSIWSSYSFWLMSLELHSWHGIVEPCGVVFSLGRYFIVSFL